MKQQRKIGASNSYLAAMTTRSKKISHAGASGME